MAMGLLRTGGMVGNGYDEGVVRARGGVLGVSGGVFIF